MNEELFCDLELSKNIDLLIDCISKEIGNQVLSFDEFLRKQNEYHEPIVKKTKTHSKN